MAFEIPGFSYTLPAAADLSANQFRAVVVNASGQAALAGADAVIAGVLQNDPAAVGREAAIMEDGVSKVEAGAALAAGAQVSTDASGRAAAAATNVFGTALEASGAAGEIIPVLLHR